MPGKVRSLCRLPLQLCPVTARLGMAGEIYRCRLALENIRDRELFVSWCRHTFGERINDNCGEDQNDWNDRSHVKARFAA